MLLSQKAWRGVFLPRAKLRFMRLSCRIRSHFFVNPLVLRYKRHRLAEIQLQNRVGVIRICHGVHPMLVRVDKRVVHKLLYRVKQLLQLAGASDLNLCNHHDTPPVKLLC